MDPPTIKAFVLCDNVSDHSSGSDQKDLHGAGLLRIECVEPLPVKLSFWAFVQLSDQKEAGVARLAVMRADSGRRFFFRSVTVRHKDTVQATVFCIRVFDCVIPDRGVYFIELWCDDVWVIDQRLEVF